MENGVELAEGKNYWDSIKNFERHDHRIFTDEQWKNASEIREVASQSDVIKSKKPVVYAGARWDFVQPLAYTDATNFIFIDPAYGEKSDESSENVLPLADIKALGGEVVSDRKEGVLGQGGKRTLTVLLGGKERKITLYGEDAITFQPKEVVDSGGASLFMSIGVDVYPTPEALVKHYKSISLGGYLLGRPGMRDASLYGFKEVIADPSDFSDPKKPQFRGRSLYQKISDPENLLEVAREEFTNIPTK